MATLRSLLRAGARLLAGSNRDAVEHGRLQHAHWDHVLRAWTTHDEEAEAARAA